MKKIVKLYKAEKINSDINPKKIFIVKLGAIGDTIMTTPFTKALREKFPKAKIHYYIGKRSKTVLEGSPHLDKIIPFDEEIMENKKLISLIKLGNKIRKQNYDLGIALDKSYLSNLFLKYCKPKISAGLNREGEGNMLNLSVKYNNEEHEVNQYLKIAYLLGAKKINKPKIESYIGSEERNKVKKDLGNKKFITLIPGGANNPSVGVDEVRRLPKKVWIEVTKELAKKHFLVFAGGPSDKDYNQEIIKKSGINALNLAGKYSIKESIALFEKAELIICNDSGPMHMAGTVCKKMITLFGASNPKRKAPRYIKIINIWKDQKNYQGSYEFYGTPPKGSFMQKITKEDILKAVKDLGFF